MKIFLDQDGVLANFVGGACKAHGLTCYDKPERLGEFSLEKCWGMTAGQFWAPTNNYDFWFNLEKTAEADEIVMLAIDAVGVENVAMLTSPSLDPDCVPAKRAWMEKCYPQLAKTMIFSWGKGIIGGPGRILIDDRDRNIDDWYLAGGEGILVPRPWNEDYKLANATLEVIEMRLKAILRMEENNVRILGQA